jgi:sialic acid synthase
LTKNLQNGDVPKMGELKFGRSLISNQSPCYIIAEIGHNHQGSLETALKMIDAAAACGVQAVKFQKRNNRALYTKAFYNRPYDNENSYGATYGEHREFLEFGLAEYRQLKTHVEERQMEFMATAFDFESVDFLEEIGISSYKIASGDVTNPALLEYIARLRKPMFISTGACTLDEIRQACLAVSKYHEQICLLHCVAGYPPDYEQLNLNFIQTLKREFPYAIIGYSGHDNGILAAVIAYMLGARVVEKHFTLNRSWKGTDHKFSLETEGMRKQVRDLRRADLVMGNGQKRIENFELDARKKMGKGIYAARALAAGHILARPDVCFKSPANDSPPYLFDLMIGRKLKVDLQEEAAVNLTMLE